MLCTMMFLKLFSVAVSLGLNETSRTLTYEGTSRTLTYEGTSRSSWSQNKTSRTHRYQNGFSLYNSSRCGTSYKKLVKVTVNHNKFLSVSTNAACFGQYSPSSGIRYRISRPIRRTFSPRKSDLNSTCVLCAEGKYYFQTYKYPYIYYTSLSWDSENH